MDKLGDAESWVETYLKEKSFSSAALYASGYIFYLKGDIKRAEELFIKAIELDGNNALALNNLGQYHSDMIKKLERDACNLYNIHYPDQSPMSISIIDLVVENLPNLIQ
jgi:Flp pilus assembly protein TadD